VIQGLRVFPAYQDAASTGSVIGSKGCEECKRTQMATTRQALRCVYEPAMPGAQSWAPKSWVERGIETTACPGYSARLPAVLEIVEEHQQWKHGTLSAALDGEQPTRGALQCFKVLEAGINEHRADLMRERSKS
jgi:hypothetical protein